MKKTNFD